MMEKMPVETELCGIEQTPTCARATVSGDSIQLRVHGRGIPKWKSRLRSLSMNIKTVTVTLSLGAGALLLVGCSSGSQPPAQHAQTAQPAVTSTPPPSGPPVSINAEMVSIVDHGD